MESLWLTKIYNIQCHPENSQSLIFLHATDDEDQRYKRRFQILLINMFTLVEYIIDELSAPFKDPREYRTPTKQNLTNQELFYMLIDESDKTFKKGIIVTATVSKVFENMVLCRLDNGLDATIIAEPHLTWSNKESHEGYIDKQHVAPEDWQNQAFVTDKKIQQAGRIIFRRIALLSKLNITSQRAIQELQDQDIDANILGIQDIKIIALYLDHGRSGYNPSYSEYVLQKYYKFQRRGNDNDKLIKYFRINYDRDDNNNNDWSILKIFIYLQKLISLSNLKRIEMSAKPEFNFVLNKSTPQLII